MSGICILQMFQLCDWVTLMNMFVGILMVLVGDMVLVRGIWIGECCLSLA